MSDNIAIDVSNVSKVFKLPHEKQTSLKSAFIGAMRKKRTYERQQVLDGISFQVKQGEFFGIVGRNGSGKSTLLKLLAGIYEPNQGAIRVEGRLTPFIELGVGFNPELTGKENVYLNSALLGFNRKQTDDMYEDIVQFAELEKFMDQKLKNYSSGMQVRLAFSIAIRAESEILLIDEVLAVGDASFQKKCFDYFRTLKKKKQTVVFISHDMNAVREYCDRAVLIDKGKIIAEGKSEKVAQEYTKLFLVNNDNDMADGKRWGNGDARIHKPVVKVGDDNVIIEVEVGFSKAAENPVFGVSVISPVGVKVFETNTKWDRIKTGDISPGQKKKITWKIPNLFTNGTNTVNLAVANQDASEFFDWWDDATSFIIDKDRITTAATLPNHITTLE